MDKETIAQMIQSVRDIYPAHIASELISVQPMSSDLIKVLIENGKSEKQLTKEGYQPVSNIGLMWIKKE